MRGGQVFSTAGRTELIGNRIETGVEPGGAFAVQAGGGMLVMRDNVLVAGPHAPVRDAAVVAMGSGAELRGNRLLNGTGRALTLLLDWMGVDAVLGGNEVGAGDRVVGDDGSVRHRAGEWARGSAGRVRSMAGGVLRAVRGRGGAMMRLVLLMVMLPWMARAAGAWDQYQIIMWQDRSPVQMQGLAALGFTGMELRATGGEIDEAGRAARVRLGLAFYLENLATDFYAPYHRYTAGKEVTWLFDAVRARRRADAGDLGVSVREPSLVDAAWLERIGARLERVVRETGGRALFYNLGDESGIADLAAAWDFDTGAASLAGFREWLRTQYADLAALNLEWGTGFADWGAVQPELTDAAVRGGDETFAAWADFKAWMDVSFARAVQVGSDAVHRGAAGALAALEGGQVPGWGGYDYALLAPAVDVMEIYDLGEALDLATAFHAGLIPLRTSFGAGNGGGGAACGLAVPVARGAGDDRLGRERRCGGGGWAGGAARGGDCGVGAGDGAGGPSCCGGLGPIRTRWRFCRARRVSGCSGCWIGGPATTTGRRGMRNGSMTIMRGGRAAGCWCGGWPSWGFSRGLYRAGWSRRGCCGMGRCGRCCCRMRSRCRMGR